MEGKNAYFVMQLNLQLSRLRVTIDGVWIGSRIY
jgi:hypothetical protein